MNVAPLEMSKKNFLRSLKEAPYVADFGCFWVPLLRELANDSYEIEGDGGQELSKSV